MFFQQLAVNAEAVSNSWSLNGYGLIPVGDVEQRLNSVYDSGALNTYGLDAGYFITPVLKASAGYYYHTAIRNMLMDLECVDAWLMK